jgi:hypothetical protein
MVLTVSSARCVYTILWGSLLVALPDTYGDTLRRIFHLWFSYLRIPTRRGRLVDHGLTCIDATTSFNVTNIYQQLKPRVPGSSTSSLSNYTYCCRHCAP